MIIRIAATTLILCLFAATANAAFKSVETRPRAKINLIPYDGEMTFFVFDASDLCGKRAKGQKLKIKMKKQRESIFVRAGHPMNFSLKFRVLFTKPVYRDFSFTPQDGYEYNIAYKPSINGAFGFLLTEIDASGTERELLVDHKLKCGDESVRTYPENPTQTVTIGDDLGESAAMVRFIAPGMRGEFLSSTGVRLWAFPDGTCDNAKKLTLKPGDRHKAFVLRGGREWLFRVFYDQRAFMGETRESSIDFAFPVEAQGEYLIEFLDNPFKIMMNYWTIDAAGKRQGLDTQASTGCE